MLDFYRGTQSMKGYGTFPVPTSDVDYYAHYAKAKYLESRGRRLFNYQVGSHDFQIMDEIVKNSGMLLAVLLAGCKADTFFLEGAELTEFNRAVLDTMPSGVIACATSLTSVVGNVTIEEHCFGKGNIFMPVFSGWRLYWPESVTQDHSNTRFSGDEDCD